MTSANTAVAAMRAVVQNRLGDASVLEIASLPVPCPQPTEIRVRVLAAGINPVDWKTREGHGMAGVLGDPPFVLGWDVAGVVDAVGFGVTTVAAGDRVYGMPWFPRAANGYSEYVTAPARQFARTPAPITDAAAAAVPLAALTAWQVLVDTAHIQAGQRVLITAGAGGVGHFAVQFARHFGAYVVATASPANHAWLRELGADEVLDYHDPDHESRIKDIDIVVDLVGNSDQRGLVEAVRPGGLFVSVPGGVSDDLAAASAEHGVAATGFLVEPDGAALALIGALIESGAVHVELAATFPLEDVAAAHRLAEANHTRGKIVLLLDEGR
jgi:NADPH:quinone reductase-like Zn-dependent oxidoreductase